MWGRDYNIRQLFPNCDKNFPRLEDWNRTTLPWPMMWKQDWPLKSFLLNNKRSCTMLLFNKSKCKHTAQMSPEALVTIPNRIGPVYSSTRDILPFTAFIHITPSVDVLLLKASSGQTNKHATGFYLLLSMNLYRNNWNSLRPVGSSRVTIKHHAHCLCGWLFL